MMRISCSKKNGRFALYADHQNILPIVIFQERIQVYE